MDTTTIDTPQGQVRGRTENGVTAFLGVPYAAAPFGPNRFRAPTAPPSWDGVRDALDHGATVPKVGYRPPTSEILSEPEVAGDDCLNVAVYTPDPGGSAPVYVWIHGGAFVNGSNAVPAYDGSAFARDGVVAVVINYRLGVDGFARIDGAPANRGLLDQVAALEWVRDHIAAYGGNPAQVTVAGESAGAMSVATLLAMPRAEGLFRRAILQSGGGHNVVAEETAARVAATLSSSLSVEPSVDGFGSVSVDALLDAQRSLSDRVAAEAASGAWGELALKMMAFQPYVDGDVVPAEPYSRIADGAGAEVEILIGTTSEEHAFFLVPAGIVPHITEDYLAAILAGYRLDPAALDVYRAQLPDASPGELMIAIMTDWFFRMPAVRIAEAHPAHVYEFTWRSPLFDGNLGACHALELPFVFDVLDKPETARITGPTPPQALADEMHRAWVDFVRTGNPGWGRYGTARTVKMFPGTTVDDPRAATREVWDGVR
ncbi:carboxylesterase/lipase family protein [Rhodococcus sp. NPDC003994]